MLMPLVHMIGKICGVLINVGMWTLDQVFMLELSLWSENTKGWESTEYKSLSKTESLNNTLHGV